MKFFKKLPPFLRYVLLYVLVVCIPVVLVISSMVYTHSVLKQEVFHSNKASVALIQNSLDSTFQELNDTLRVVGSNPNLSRYNLLFDPMNSIDSIADIVSAHSCLYDLILYVRDGDQFCSASGCFDINSLSSQQFAKDFLDAGYTSTAWLDLMQTVTDPVYLSGAAQGQSNYLCLVTPIFYSTMQTSGAFSARTATMVVRQDYITNLFLSSQTASEESMLLLSPNCTPLSKLTSTATDPYVSEISAYIASHPEIYSEGYAKLPGSDILIFVSRSGETGLSYVRFVPESAAFGALHSQNLFAVIFFVLIVSIGVILTVTALRRSDLPIRFFSSILQPAGISADIQPSQPLTDGSHIPTAALPPDASRPDLIDRLLTNLISGSFSSETDFRNACEAARLRMDRPYFAVCSLLVEEDGSGDAAISFDRIFDAIRFGLPSCYRLYAKDYLSARKLVLIINSDSNDPKLYQTTMSQIKTRLLEQEHLTASIGMGFFYDSYEDANKSYKDSMTALDYRLIYGRNCLITPEIYNSSSPEITSSYPSYDLSLLDTALSSRNAEMALTVLNRINAAVKLKNYNLYITKNLCDDIFSIIKKNPDFTDVISANDLPPLLDVSALSSHATVDAFFSSLSELILSRLNTLTKPEPLVQTNIGAQLLEYVDAHCLSYDFQIKNMAEHFSISPQYMRKLFKSQAGISVSEYVSNKRLEKAIYLLTQTDMNLQDIVSEIGNSDISGFVRFFKQKTGLTPGQYRKHYKEQEQEQEGR